MKNIEDKILSVYNFTLDYVDNNGYPPSIREICEKLNIKSTATAYSYVEKLKQRGLLEKSPLKKRAISVTNNNKNIKNVPIVGTIRAGAPIFAEENIEGYLPLSNDFLLNGEEFALKVVGDSMINAGIFEGDVIIVNKQNVAENGQIVVAMIDDEATVKRLVLKDGKVILRPENSQMSDMVFDNVEIIGVVKGLIRKF